ncbi:acyltransferase family protein [Sphingobacterium detergens]|uniref:acyltransferase family protein n=1 Tax=Sphingobacterium detergens TaxID=1145106 RepID=UPI003AAF4838
MNFRDDIQGLRAVAVLLVFIFHLSASLLPGGFIGVDMFFVISGYLVTGIVYSKINKGSFSILDFYKSRVRRIVPAYLFLLVCVAIGASFLFISSDAQIFRRSLFWTLLFNSNNYFAALDNYFGATSSENPLLHTWTLAVEMQFYFILPIILLIVRNKKVLVFLLSVITLGLFGYSTYGILNNGAQLMYFSLPSRMPEFLIGALAAIVKVEDLQFIKKNSNIFAFLGISAILICACLFSEATPFPGATSLIPCLGTLALLISNRSKINDILSTKYLVYTGEISYSLYLWHWPVMAFYRYYKNEYEFTISEKIVVLLATAIFSLISYYLIEHRLRKTKGFRFIGPFITLGMAVAAMYFLVPKINNRLFEGEEDLLFPKFGLDSHAQTFKKVETFGDSITDKTKILFLGDSHALCMKNYIDIIGDRNGFSFKTITNNTYPTLPGITPDKFDNIKLLDQYNMLMKYVDQEIPKADLIIVQFAGTGEKWSFGLKKLLSKMRVDQKLLVLEDFPTLDKNPVRINKDVIKRNDIEQNYTLNRNKISAEILKIIASDSRSKYIDLTKSKVFGNAPFYNDTLMYYDKGHLNLYGSKVYALDTEKLFLENLGLRKH